jgi:hypothetical protein
MDEDALVCRHIYAWYAYVEGAIVTAAARLDLEEAYDVAEHEADEAYGPVDKRWYAFLDERQFEIRMDLIERLRSLTDGSVPYLVHRGLEALIVELEAAQAEPQGSVASAPVVIARPPVAIDPVPPDEARALFRRFLRRAG